MDVYILLYRIEDGGLYLLEVLVVGIEVGQVVALYDTGLLVAHAADLQIQVFYAYPVVVDVIVQIVYADDGSGLRFIRLYGGGCILLVDNEYVVLAAAQVKEEAAVTAVPLSEELCCRVILLSVAGSADVSMMPWVRQVFMMRLATMCISAGISSLLMSPQLRRTRMSVICGCSASGQRSTEVQADMQHSRLRTRYVSVLFFILHPPSLQLHRRHLLFPL